MLDTFHSVWSEGSRGVVGGDRLDIGVSNRRTRSYKLVSMILMAIAIKQHSNHRVVSEYQCPMKI